MRFRAADAEAVGYRPEARRDRNGFGLGVGAGGPEPKPADDGRWKRVADRPAPKGIGSVGFVRGVCYIRRRT